jgi:type VI secretion system secreted protein Hcp
MEGIVTDELVKEKGATELSSFQFGVGIGVSISKGGVEKGTASVSEVTCTKAFDNMSPALFINCCLGKTFDKITIDFVGAVGDASKGSAIYLTYELQNAIITGHSISSGGDKPSESFSITFEEIVMTYQKPPVTKKNAAGQPIVQTWSIIGATKK